MQLSDMMQSGKIQSEKAELLKEEERTPATMAATVEGRPPTALPELRRRPPERAAAREVTG